MSGAKRKGNYSTPQKFSFTLSLSGLAGCAVGLVVLLSSFFALGVVVGRGYQPEAAVPELARLIPTPESTAGEAESEGQKAEVLKAEDLQYMDRLKKSKAAPAGHAAAAAEQKKAGAAESQPAAEAAQKAESKSESAASPKAQPVPAQAAVETPAQTEEKAAKQTAKVEAAQLAEKIERSSLNGPEQKNAASEPILSEDEDQTVYDYIYQAASFKQPEMAEAFREKIASLGLGAAIQKAKSKSSTWYRVVVHFQGRPDETREMKAKLKTLGVNRPIMQSKKPM